MGRTIVEGPNLAWFAPLGAVLVILKLLHLADDCSWWVVVSPFYVPLALFYLFAFFVFVRSQGNDHDGKPGRSPDAVNDKTKEAKDK